MKRYKSCLLKFTLLEKHIRDIKSLKEEQCTLDCLELQGKNEKGMISSFNTFASDQEAIIDTLDLDTRSSSHHTLDSTTDSFDAPKTQSPSIKRSSQELDASYYTEADTSFNSDTTLNSHTDRIIPTIKDLLQKINETDIVFINRHLKETVEITFITDCSNTLLISLENEIDNLCEYGDIGSVFKGILNDLIRLRMDMNKFYSMYYCIPYYIVI